MAFEEETHQQQDEEHIQLQKKRENDKFQRELDEIIQRLENKQFQKELDEIIARKEQKPQEHGEEQSSNESMIEKKSEQQKSIEQSIDTWNDELFSQHEENVGDNQAQRLNLEANIERIDWQISQQEDIPKEHVIDRQITEKQVKKKQDEEKPIIKVQNTEIEQEKRDKEEKEAQKNDEKDKEKLNERFDRKTREKTQEKKEIHDLYRKAEGNDIQDFRKQEEKTQENKGESKVKTKQAQTCPKLSSYLEQVQEKNSESELPISRKDYVVTTNNNSVEDKKNVSNDLKTVVSSQSHSNKLKNTGYIFKDGKWHMETEWVGYPTISYYLQKLSRSKLDGLKLWVQFRNELEAASMKNRVNKPLYYSLKIKPGRDIPQKLIGKRVYVQNQELYFKNGWYPNKFNYPKDQPVVSYFQKYFMDKIDKTWLNVPPWKGVKIRNAMFQQFYEKIAAFTEVKNKS